MSGPTAWHSQDRFWEVMEPALFNPQRQASAIAEVEQIVRLLQIDPQHRILDLCCGIGRHSLEFAQRGFEIVGIDRTAQYIERARAAAAQRNLHPEFIVGDMREYCVPGRFDIVLNLFGSFGYFEDPGDHRKVVENMVASLRPRGKFLIETMGKEILARGFPEREWEEVDDLLVLSEKKVSQSWSRIQTRWIIIKGTQRTEYTTSLRSFSAVELSSLLQECGFPDVQVYGDLEGSVYDQTAKRLVMIGCK